MSNHKYFSFCVDVDVQVKIIDYKVHWTLKTPDPKIHNVSKQTDIEISCTNYCTLQSHCCQKIPVYVKLFILCPKNLDVCCTYNTVNSRKDLENNVKLEAASLQYQIFHYFCLH